MWARSACRPGGRVRTRQPAETACCVSCRRTSRDARLSGLPRPAPRGGGSAHGLCQAERCASGADAVRDTCDRHVLGDEHDVQLDAVARPRCLLHQGDLTGVTEDGFGDERPPVGDCVGADGGRGTRRVVGVPFLVTRPLGSRNFVSVDERQAGGRPKHGVHERRLAGAVGPGNDTQQRRAHTAGGAASRMTRFPSSSASAHGFPAA